jgi:hypothetical protein
MPIAMLPGCARQTTLPPIPSDLVSAAQIPGIPQARQWGDEPGAAFHAGGTQPGSVPALQQSSTPVPLRVLALSGGGANAAFAAGLLTGWTDARTRPTFHVVTGVSAGALAAPFALLGSVRDETLRSLFTGLAGADLVQERSRVVALFSDSLARSEPLRRVIDEHFDAALMREIAAEHRRGRRLIVGTTHVYAGRLVAWNIGAIADSGHADALELIRRVLLASAAVPIMLPPVYVEVEAAGRRYHEMHVDGGMTRQVFVAPPGVDWSSVAQRNQRHGGLEFYVIRNGRVRSEYMLMPDRLVPLGEHALHLLAQSQGVGDLYIIYVQAQRAGAAYKAAWIGDAFQAPWTQWYDPPYMRALFDYAYREAAAGTVWHSEPPGFTAASSRP